MGIFYVKWEKICNAKCLLAWQSVDFQNAICQGKIPLDKVPSKYTT
jgi:hypothetical protein